MTTHADIMNKIKESDPERYNMIKENARVRVNELKKNRLKFFFEKLMFRLFGV